MHISDWSSDVCSSDLTDAAHRHGDAVAPAPAHGRGIADLVDPLHHHPAVDLAAVVDVGGLREEPEFEFALLSAHALLRIGRHRRNGRACIRSEEHTSELQSLMRISYAVFCLKKK